MKKILYGLLITSSISYAGVIKIRNTGQPDAYVPTMDSDNSSNLTVKGLKATTSTLTTVNATTANTTTVNATTVNATNIIAPGFVPLGGMIAVTPAIDTVNSWQPPATGVIKDGFMRADGNTVPSGQGSPLQGKALPNMGTTSGGVNRYPRGSAATSWTTGAYTTGGANTQALVLSNIPQLSTSYTPAGTTNTTGSSHSHDITPNPHSHATIGTSGASGAGSYSHIISGYTNNYNVEVGAVGLTIGTVGSTHTHEFVGTLATITVGTPVGSMVAPNNEPSYLEVIWVIRVK